MLCNPYSALRDLEAPVVQYALARAMLPIHVLAEQYNYTPKAKAGCPSQRSRHGVVEELQGSAGLNNTPNAVTFYDGFLHNLRVSPVHEVTM